MKKIWICAMLLLVTLGLLLCACGEQPDHDAVLPDMANNPLTQFPYTALWYMRTILEVENGVKYEGEDMMRIVALFDHVTFEEIDATNDDQMRALFEELMDGQYIVLEGAGTVTIGENGKIMLSLPQQGKTLLSAAGAIDPQALRDMIATLDAEKME